MAEHTKTPWFVSSTCLICDEGAAIVANLFPMNPITCGVGLDESEANAEFIVRACNNYDSLLAALAKIQKLADRALGQNDMHRGKLLNDIGNISEQAIAQAKENNAPQIQNRA